MLSDHALLAILTGCNGLQLVVLLAWSLVQARRPIDAPPVVAATHTHHYAAPTHGPHGPVG